MNLESIELFIYLFKHTKHNCFYIFYYGKFQTKVEILLLQQWSTHGQYYFIYSSHTLPSPD